MLIGYDKRETWERVLYRFNKMVARQIRPYPMIYGDRFRSLPAGGCHPAVEQRTLAEFQRYVIRRVYYAAPFETYTRKERSYGTDDLFATAAE